MTFNIEINGLSADSRKIEAGFLFAALPGASADGRDFIAEAVDKGAVAVLAPPGTRLPENCAAVDLLTDADPRRLYAHMAARFFDARPQHVAAITGTNGKSSAADFTRQLWSLSGRAAASLGTLGAIGPGGREAVNLTTPDPVELHRRLAGFAEAGITHAVIEASSHGLDQRRLAGLAPEVAAFTHLGRDHLDYHGTPEEYLGAKLRLFADIVMPGGTAVLNADEATYPDFKKVARRRGLGILTYGRSGADLRLAGLRPMADGQVLDIELGGTAHRVTLPLIGEFQAMNALAGLAIVLATDGAAEVADLARLAGVPGRLQAAARHKLGGAVYVDYAHTPDALEAALGALRPHTEGRLLLVFGCGGERDRGKRGLMGSIAARGADKVIVTDDNPRGEDPGAIRRDILAGCPHAQEIGERGPAIRSAIQSMGAGDLVLIAGKGHEAGQIVGDAVLPFDDVTMAAKAVAEMGS